jgi:hypothetical protein
MNIHAAGRYFPHHELLLWRHVSASSYIYACIVACVHELGLTTKKSDVSCTKQVYGWLLRKSVQPSVHPSVTNCGLHLFAAVYCHVIRCNHSKSSTKPIEATSNRRLLSHLRYSNVTSHPSRLTGANVAT